SAFKHVYTYAQRYRDQHRELWPCVRRELLVVIALAPLFRCNLRRQSWSKLVATDASMIGSGAVATHCNSRMQSLLWPVMTQPECSLLPSMGEDDVPNTPNQQETAWPVLQAPQPVLFSYNLQLQVESARHAIAELCTSPSTHWSTIISSLWN